MKVNDSVTFAAVYNTCYTNKHNILKHARKHMTHPQLRIRYHWTRHIRTIATTQSPITFKSLSDITHEIQRQHSLNHIAYTRALRIIQRAVVAWVWRPHGPVFQRVLLPQFRKLHNHA